MSNLFDWAANHPNWWKGMNSPSGGTPLSDLPESPATFAMKDAVAEPVLDDYRVHSYRQAARKAYKELGGDFDQWEAEVRGRRAQPNALDVNQDLSRIDRPVPVTYTRNYDKVSGVSGRNPIGRFSSHTGEATILKQRYGADILTHELGHGLQNDNHPEVKQLVFRTGGASDADDAYFSQTKEIDRRLPVIRLLGKSSDPAIALANIGFSVPGSGRSETVPVSDSLVRTFRDYYNNLPESDKRTVWDYMTKTMPYLVRADFSPFARSAA